MHKRFYIYSLILKYIKKHRRTFDKNNLRDLLDVYLIAQNDRGFDELKFAS